MFCKNCGYKLEKNQKNCPLCGTPNEFFEKNEIECPHCGQINDSSNTNCEFCHEPLKKENHTRVKYCKKCKTKLSPLAMYCYNCGSNEFTSSEQDVIETSVQEKIEVNEVDFEKKRKISLIGILVYFGVFYLVAPLLTQILMVIVLKAYNVDMSLIKTTDDLIKNYQNVYALILALSNLVTYGLLFASAFVIMFRFLKEDLIILRTNKRSFFVNFGITLGLLYATSILSNIVLNIILITTGLSKYDTGNSQNQEAINLILTSSPVTCVITLLMTIVAAPIIEELIFRKGFFNISRKKGAKAIVISGLIFGAIHVIDALISGISSVIAGEEVIQTVITQFLYIISYASSGIVLGYCYYKANYNITSNIAAHMAYNAIGIILTLLTFLIS